MADSIGTSSNALVSNSTSDSSLSVQLHPLVLLTISDYITRHSLRQQPGPIIGAIIGQQHGREVTMEHAFECKVVRRDGEQTAGGQEAWLMDDEWFAARLEQYQAVHKAPALELVALFTLAPETGPLPQHIPILQQIQQQYNDSLLLMLFHTDIILNGALAGGKLPISIYESFYASDGGDDEDESRQQQMRFRQLTYEVETGQAEMIGIDFVAKGGGNATAVANNTGSSTSAAAAQKTGPQSSKGKGKASVVAEEDQANGGEGAESGVGALSPEDDELIASLTGKANAIKMLHRRIDLIKAYLSTLPPSYLTDPTIPTSPETSSHLNQPLLRNISSLLSRLPLLTPPSNTSTTAAPQSSLTTASAHEQSDVYLVNLLSSLTRSIAQAKDLGTKYSVVSKARTDRGSALGGLRGSGVGGLGGMPRGGFGGMDDSPFGTPGEVGEFGVGGL